MDEQRLELRVGALALVALAIAVTLVITLTGFVGGNRFTLFADFGFAGGLSAGAPVKISGVKVGRIREVQFRPDAHDASGRLTPVRLVVDVDRSAAVALRTDAVAAVGTQGALGESFLELIPGNAPAPLAERSAIAGYDPPRLDLVLARLFSFLNDATNDAALKNFLVQLGSLANGFNSFLTANRDDITRTFKNVGELMGSAQDTLGSAKVAAQNLSLLLSSPEIKQIVGDFSVTARSARTELPGLLADTHAMVSRLQTATGNLSEEDVAHVKDMLVRYDALGTQLQTVSSRADALLSAIQRGDGTLGKVIKDPKVYDDLRALLADIKAKPWKLVWKE
jgi:phospholipid/cholesterol/gamma-HCH transport system substrate-binding protein